MTSLVRNVSLIVLYFQKFKVIKDGWTEFSVKNVIELIKDDKILKEYLPFDEILLGRIFDK
jgi:hypothetical protein